MTLDGAINLSETNDYIIYTMNSVTTGQYGVVVPKGVSGTLKMLVDLHMKSSFDGIGAGTKTREQLISEINDEYNKLKTRYVDSMLVMPMIDEVLFQSVVVNGDKQKMFDEVKKIGAITSELYKKLIAQGVEKQKIDQKIIIVEKRAEDEKFVIWLKEQMPNFVDGVLYNELNVIPSNVNPFVDSNSIFGPAQVVSTTVSTDAPVVNAAVSSSEIFDNISPVSDSVSNPVVDSVSNVSTVSSVSPPSIDFSTVNSEVSSDSVVGNNDFSVPTSVSVVSTSQSSPVVPSSATSDVTTVNSVFGPSVVTSGVESSVATMPTSVVDEPKPVASASLEETMTISPVAGKDDDTVEGEDTGAVRSKSQGFVNLLILLVILAVVTIVSIEIGKYLYGVYGA